MSPLPRVALLPVLLLPLACASSAVQLVPFPSQDVPVTRPDLARIYVLRDDARVLQDRPVKIFDGEREIGTLDNGTYLCWERPGGRTLARAYFGAMDPSRGQLEGIASLDCAAGTVSYYKVVVSREEGRPSIEAVGPDEGRKLVSERRAAGR
jgi:hypothetical protein